MDKLFYYLGLCMFGMLAMGVRIIFILARPAVRGVVNSVGGKRPQLRTVKVETEPASVQVQVPEAVEPAEDTGPETVFINDSNFAGADRIVSIKLDPPVGTLYLRLFHKERMVKRELIIWEPKLKRLMGGRKHDLPDVKYDALDGLDPIKDESIGLVESLINERGNEKVKGVKPPRKADPLTRPKEPEAPAKAQPAPQPAAPVPVAPHAMRQVTPEQRQPDATPDERVFVPKARDGYTYVGQLLHGGPRTVTPRGRNPYEVFEATIRLDNGAELPLRGAELERALVQAGCEKGDRISVTPMGKVPVDLSNGGKGEKNLYKVLKMPHAARN